jgi:hypothetical protein
MRFSQFPEHQNAAYSHIKAEVIREDKEMQNFSLEDCYFPPGRFSVRGSAIYEETIKVLRKLVKAEGIDAAQSAYATAVSDSIRKNWAKCNQATLDGGKGHWCVRMLLGETCRRQICGPDEIPALSHGSFWRRDGKPPLLVSQPYGLDLEDLRELVEVSDRYAFDVHVTAHSFWNAGNSMLIEIGREGNQ